MADADALLERPVYRFAEADRLLRVARGTVQRWVDGDDRRGGTDPPVVRERSTGSPWVTWGEFVEARLLSEIRTVVPTPLLRRLVDHLRRWLGQPYPLASDHVYRCPEGRELLLSAQRESGVDGELRIVVPAGPSAVLTATGRRFVAAVVRPEQGGTVLALRAAPGTPSVLLDPVRRQGQPSVHGVPTATLAQLVRAGEPVDYVAASYGFSVDEIEQALSYEAARQAFGSGSAAGGRR